MAYSKMDNKTKNGSIVGQFIHFTQQNRLLMLLNVVVIFLGYGFILWNSSIYIDDTAVDRYLYGSDLLVVGRFANLIINRLTGLFQYAPFWQNAVALIFLLFGTVIWCILLQSAAKGSLSKTALAVFSTVFVSYPIIHRIFIYMCGALTICMCYLIIALALFYTEEFFKSKKYKPLVIASTLCGIAVNMYESFVPVYICGMFCILILNYLNSESKLGFKPIVKKSAVMLLPVSVGIILHLVIGKAIVAIFAIEGYGVADRSIIWGTKSFFNVAISFFKEVITKFFLAGTVYFSIFIFALAIAVMICITAVLCAKRRSFVLFLLFSGLILSNFSLSILMGFASSYRMCQVFSLFIAFTFMLLVTLLKKKKGVYAIALCVITLIVLNQTRDLNQWFYLNHMRYEYDKTIAVNVGVDIQKVDYSDKPVVFVGKKESTNWMRTYEPTRMPFFDIYRSTAGKLLPYRVNKKVENFKMSYLDRIEPVETFQSWGVDAFREVNTEWLKFMEIHGFTFDQGSCDDYYQALELAENMPVWPKEGSILVTERMVVVKMANDLKRCEMFD